MSEQRIDEIQLALQHIEVNWDDINNKVEKFNSDVNVASTQKDMKKIATEASSLLGELQESEKLISECIARFNALA
ncbi:putative Calcium-binding protein [Entamoeba marina]